MDSHNIGKQCFPIVSERYVVRTFSRQSLSSPFLQKKPCFRTFQRFLSFAPLAHPCTLCSASKYRKSCDTCKQASWEVPHPCPFSSSYVMLHLHSFGRKMHVFQFSILEKIHGMERSLFPFLERCTTFVRYRSLVVCIQHAAKKK